MKQYRFAVHPEEDGYHFLECLNDPKLYTQARSMDEALRVVRDVIEAVYDYRDVLIEFVVPPDVTLRSQLKRNGRRSRERRRRLSTARG